MVFEAIYQVEGDYGIILFDLPTSLEDLLAMGRQYEVNEETWVELLLPRDFIQGGERIFNPQLDSGYATKDCTHYLAHRYDKSPRFNRSTWDSKTYALSSRNQTSIGWLRLDTAILDLSQTRLMWPKNANIQLAGNRYVRGYKLQLSLPVLQRIYNERPFIRGLGVTAYEEKFWWLRSGETYVIRLKSVYGSDSPFFENYVTFNYP